MPALPGSVDIATMMLIEEEAADGARAGADQCAPVTRPPFVQDRD